MSNIRPGRHPGSGLPSSSSLLPEEQKDPRWSQRSCGLARKGPDPRKVTQRRSSSAPPMWSAGSPFRSLGRCFGSQKRLVLSFQATMQASSDFRMTLTHNNLRFKVILIESVDLKQPDISPAKWICVQLRIAIGDMQSNSEPHTSPQ